MKASQWSNMVYMKLTTIGILKALPFEQNFKEKLIQDLSSMDPDKKFLIVQMIWDTYKALYEIKLEENMQNALGKVKEGAAVLDDELYIRVKEQTDKEFESETFTIGNESELAEVRKKLETLLAKPN